VASLPFALSYSFFSPPSLLTLASASPPSFLTASASNPSFLAASPASFLAPSADSGSLSPKFLDSSPSFLIVAGLTTTTPEFSRALVSTPNKAGSNPAFAASAALIISVSSFFFWIYVSTYYLITSAYASKSSCFLESA
jgi:hypothetical protein